MWNRFRKRLIGNGGHDIFRNMLVLLAGAGVARAVGMLSILALTRIYGPEDFGILSVFNAFLLLILPLGTLRYVVAVPLPKTDRMAVNLLVICFLSIIFVSLSLFLCFFMFSSQIFPVFSAEKLIPYWWLIIIAFIGASFYELLASWGLRQKAFRAISRTQVTQSLLGACLKIGLGLLSLKPLGLLIGQVVQQAGGVLYLLRQFAGGLKQNLPAINLSKIWFATCRFRDMPYFRLPSQMLLVFSMQSPLLFVAARYDIHVAGQLGLALNALTLPVALFSRTASQAFYAEVAKIGRREPERIYEVTIDTIKRMALVGFLPTIVLMAFGPWIFSVAFGDEWSHAGQYSRWLALYLFMVFLSQPIVQVLTVFGRNMMFFVINAIRVLVLSVIFLGVHLLNLDDMTFIIIYAAALSLHYIYVCLQSLSVVRREIKVQ